MYPDAKGRPERAVPAPPMPHPRNIKLTLAYDGTDFFGWQIQSKGRTVQGVLQEALERIHGYPVRVVAAGRTDSGVHATGQVANFRSDIVSISGERFRDALNAYLPSDVRVLKSEEAVPLFHARRSARLRTYRYYILAAPVCPPHLRKYCLWIKRRPDISRLNEMASLVEGEHDFSSFSARRDGNRSKVRRIAASSFHAEGGLIIYTITASSFLWKMVRGLIGTFLSLDEAGQGAEEFRRILEARSRFEAGATAPSQGLFLEKVEYEER